MTDVERRKNAKAFVSYWNNHSKSEKQDDQTFWNMFLRDILGVENSEKVIEYQKPTDGDKTQWMDAYIKGTNVIIEQKSGGVNLLEPTRQSDGSSRNAFEQAKNYDDNMNKSNKADWIITCNFDKFLIYNMNDIKKKYIEINLEDLPSCYDNFYFLIDKTAKVNDLETAISKEAGKIIGNIHNEIEHLLIEQKSLNDETQKYLNEFCVRLVFCFFAEDSGLFKKRQFTEFIEHSNINHLQDDLLDLFKVLNTKERRTFLREELNAFPYVNGELFSDEIDIPPLNENIMKLILEDACGFDWSRINPTIFGAIFESTLNPETRRNGGMHYTSIENIHKVIDPLFLNDLKKEFSEIRKGAQINVKIKKLNDLQDKISKLVFLDPACGSGNFLTETYLELRRLENNILREIIRVNKGERELFSHDSDLKSLIKVRIQQFYGIEINDFAVAVSKTALWIAEFQMYLETIDLYMSYTNVSDFLPLDPYNNIIEANALKIDWNDVVSNIKCNYIMGNPPFVGKKEQSRIQKEELLNNFSNKMGVGILDYVTGWYIKACNYMKSTNIKAAFVSTNSITQGEQVPVLWPILLEKGINIIFAHRTFRWDSEANIKAHVHCVIIGFSLMSNNTKYIFENVTKKKASNINPYLIDFDNIIIKGRSKPICNVPQMLYGSMPIDKNNLILNPKDLQEYMKDNNYDSSLVKLYIGGDEYINSKKRYCLWLKDVNPNRYIHSKFVMDRINKTRKFRLSSDRPQTLAAANTPHLFGEIRQPNKKMLLIPKVSSENRRYIPIGFVNFDTIVNGSALIIPGADLYLFGILTSSVHNAWMRTVAGRLEMRYQYSASNVYNTFPFPKGMKQKNDDIIRTAKMILDARKKYKNYTLAELYGESMYLFPDLLKAHQENDKAVMRAYGFNDKMAENEIVAELMKMYQELTKDK